MLLPRQSMSPAISQALAEVRNGEPGEIPAAAIATVEKAIIALWQRLQANADYVMASDEFALFNYARARFTQGQDKVVAQKAVSRYWNSYTSDNGVQ